MITIQVFDVPASIDVPNRKKIAEKIRSYVKNATGDKIVTVVLHNYCGKFDPDQKKINIPVSITYSGSVVNFRVGIDKILNQNIYFIRECEAVENVVGEVAFHWIKATA